ncbi:dipeptide ABC transporter ATP-binding protein [Halorhodospira halophila]|uniref:dipeptide ABC transporter ATP-binding protein n=1 Tax=Halorhodospira halophila TaxID=1053 RepID=UPI0019146289|nr:microcin ABC transporter ATP-binding protein [Halorhodospira halophila]
MAEPLLSIRGLQVAFGDGAPAVRGVDLDIAAGETVGLVGESGSGKSVTAHSVLQLLPYPWARHPAGSIRFRGRELLGAPEPVLREHRGGRIGMIFQEPMSSLNPLHTVEKQIRETLLVHRGLDRVAARRRVRGLLEQVQLPDPQRLLSAYPHQLSGGQRQRVMIAMALANEPDLLIADEPTTALDVTVQAQILSLLADLKARLGMALLFITHDLDVIRLVADRVCVMRQGEIVERGEVQRLFSRPEHPYTRQLLAARPAGEPVATDTQAPVLLHGAGVRVHFPVRGGLLRRPVDWVRAVDGIDITLRAGQTVAVVGESGSGKSTLGLALLRLERSSGSIRFRGDELQGRTARQLRPYRSALQIVFQDPYGSLSPRMAVGDIVGEGLDLHHPRLSREQRTARIVRVLAEVGLDPETRHRYPHEFSGGQRQRIAIARALILEPQVVVLDEPTSALDVSVQAQIIDLLRDLQRRRGLAYLFISHDLQVVRALAHEVLVMQAGRVVERGPAEAVFAAPQDPYTRALMAAAFLSS